MSKEPVFANILIKNSENKNLISEFFKTDDKGKITAILEKNYSKIYFDITAIGYKKISDSIVNPIKKSTYFLEYVLIEKVTELQEVIITKEKFEIKEDTVSFNPKSYKDGTEKKVEDLIKKLPGMEVDGNGTIKYRGKNVTAVQLEGDDLFGYNYTLGTRNISVDIIEKVQVIDNYSVNPLLKGIENSDNVSLNLKLKKGKLEMSGDGNISSGVNSQIDAQNDISLNLLEITKKYKSFQNISYNNVGSNRASEDYFSMSSNLYDVENEELIAKKIIKENVFSSNFDYQRANINNQLVLSYNSIYRFSQKISLKTNISFVKDKIYQLENNKDIFFPENIIYNDQTSTIKNPENKKIELKLTYNTSKFSLLEAECTLQKEKINTSSAIIQNQNTTFNTILNSDNIFWKNKLQYTHKINPSKAFQFISNYSINKSPQELNINQTLFSFGGNLQKSEFVKEYLSSKMVLLGSSKKLKYAFVVGSTLEKNPFNSILLENDNIINSNFQNHFEYTKSSFYSEIGATYIFKNWKIQPTLKVSNINQKYESKTEVNIISKKSTIAIPNLNISYFLNNKTVLNLSGNYENKTPIEENLFSNYIAQNNRLIQRNELNLNLQKNQTYSLSYRYNNLFTSFATNASLIYDNSKNTYLSSVEIQNDYVKVTAFQSPTNIENYSLNFGIEKYFDFIKTTIKHSSNYAIFNYKNIVNQSEIRNNQSLNYNAYFYFNTAFRLPINFQNKFNYSTINFKTDNENNNTNISLSNGFKILVKPNKSWLFTFSYDYYLPNTKNKDDFTFLDLEIKYKPKKFKNIEFLLTGKNLMDNKFYSQTENSDFQTTIYQSILIPRYYLITIDFKI